MENRKLLENKSCTEEWDISEKRNNLKTTSNEINDTKNLPEMLFWTSNYMDVVLMNVLDEVFANMEGMSPDELVSAASEYVDRAVGLSIKPRNLVMIMTSKPWIELINYYNKIRNYYGFNSLDKWNYIALPKKLNLMTLADIKSLADLIIKRYQKELNKRKELEWIQLTSFFEQATALKLFNLLNEFSVETYKDNSIEVDMEKVNDKTQQRKILSDFMVVWDMVSLEQSNEELQKELEEKFDKGNGVIVRLPRSVSWWGFEKITTKEEISDFVNNMKLVDWWSNLNNKLTIESSVIWEDWTSPNVQVYFDGKGNQYVFAITEQILDDYNQHNWNVVLNKENNRELTEKIEEVTEEIGRKLSNEFFVVWHAWLDFILAKPHNISPWMLRNQEKVKFNVNNETYYLILCEVNRRINWSYGSAMIYNMFPEFQENYISNLNSVKHSLNDCESLDMIHNKIINKLKYQGLLFQPMKKDPEKTYWVYPFAVHRNKIQLVFVAKNKEHFNKLREQVDEVLNYNFEE